MPSLKNRISSPLEAGTSILDAHHLPPHLDAALEYASKRLERKGLRVTLVVVRREYQLHRLSSASSSASTTVATADSIGHSRAVSVSSQYASPSLMSPPPTPASVPSLTTPSRAGFGSTIKSLVRSGTHPVLPSLERANAAAFDLQRCQTISPALSCTSFSSASSVSTAGTARSTSSSTRFRWPLSPPPSASSTSSSIPMTPATPATPASTVSSSYSNTTSTTTTGDAEASAPLGANPFGIRLVHATFLPPRHERIVRQTIEKAERKFDIGTDWLAPALSASSLGLSPTLIRRSLQQSEIVFRSTSTSPSPACTSTSSVPKSAPGLTLIALDHLYTFKAALATYSASARCPYRLEDAVDELRRFVLANGGEKLPRSSLIRTYGGELTFGEAALRDVERMYRRAYGGLKQVGGIEWDEGGSSPARSVSVRTAQTSVSSLEKELEVEAEKRNDDCDTEFEEDEDGGEKVFEEISEKMITLDGTSSTPPTVMAITPPPPSQSVQRGPLLKLKTTFDEPLPTRRRPQKEVVEIADDTQEESFNLHIELAAEEDDEEEERTARPIAPGLAFWNSMSIDEVLRDDTKSDHRRSSLVSSLTGGTRGSRQGPMTPNGYDDISPITRGEWGFLMGDQMGKQVTITTC